MNLLEFEKWALAQKSVGNPTAEGSYNGQCVSLVQQYLSKVHGIPFKARGNAKEWANIEIEGFTKLTGNVVLYAGDILVYNYGRYGHIALITVDGKMLEQNKNGNRIVTISDIDFNYVCVHRPANIDLGIVTDNYNVGQVYTTKVDLKVREGAGTNYRQKNKAELTVDGQKNAYNYTSAVLKTGTRVTLLEKKVINNDEIWGRIHSGWIAFKYEVKEYVK